MRRALAFLLFVAPLAACGRAESTHTYSISLEDAGARIGAGPFYASLSCLVRSEDGTSAQQSLIATIPSTTTFKGTWITCDAQPKSEYSTLRMTIGREDGSTVGSSESYETFGVVSVTEH